MRLTAAWQSAALLSHIFFDLNPIAQKGAKSFHIQPHQHWIKQWDGLRQFKLRGTNRVSAVFGLHVITYKLIQLSILLKPVMAAEA